MHKNRQRGFSMIELLIVTLIALVIAAMAVPGFQSIERYLRIAGDCRNIFSITAQAKMQAASQFTHARARVGLASNMYGIEIWDKASNQWSPVGGRQTFSQGVTPGFGTVANPPLNTQVTLAQAPLCVTTAPGSASPSTTPNDVCIEFNSRGIPVDYSGTPAGNGAFYVTDGNSVYGVTVSVSGLIQSWYINKNDTNWQRR
ncbi:MAG: type II secretion system GspH family protein [Acidobacteriia bacterium]|nr:type II secretion system GspH family protein [Terriglobia bacterium]MBZ5702282.1 type II secretion system GspH family protein [Terriglobia bacterium]